VVALEHDILLKLPNIDDIIRIHLNDGEPMEKCNGNKRNAIIYVECVKDLVN